MRGPFISAHQEYFLSKVGIQSIADKRFAARKDRMTHLDALNQPRPRRAIALKADGSVADTHYITDSTNNNDIIDARNGKMMSFSYVSPDLDPNQTTSHVAAPEASTSSSSRTSNYNTEEALGTLRMLRKKNSVDFSQFWGWERKQRIAAAAGDISAHSSIDGRSSATNIGKGSAQGQSSKEKRALSQVDQRVQAVQSMRAVYGLKPEGPVGSSITGTGFSIDGTMGDSISLFAAEDGFDHVSFTAPSPHIITAPNTANEHDQRLKSNSGPGGATMDNNSITAPPYRGRKPKIADLVLTDEHFDAVSKYFSPDTSGGQNNIYKEAGLVHSGQAWGHVLRVTPQNATNAPIYVYSPVAGADAKGPDDMAARPQSRVNAFSPTFTGTGAEDSLDDLLSFMDAVEGSL